MIDDMYSLLAQVREWELQSHSEANSKRGTAGERHGFYMAEKAYRRVAEYIENNPKQLHRSLSER